MALSSNSDRALTADLQLVTKGSASIEGISFKSNCRCGAVKILEVVNLTQVEHFIHESRDALAVLHDFLIDGL